MKHPELRGCAVLVAVDGRQRLGRIASGNKTMGVVEYDLNGERECARFTWDALRRSVEKNEVLLA